MSGASYHVEIKFRNGCLMKSVSEMFPPSNPRQMYADFLGFSRKCGVHYAIIMRLLSCTISPYRNRDDWRMGQLTQSARKICEFLGMSQEVLFPTELYGDFVKNTVSGYIPADRILSLSDPEVVRMLPEAQGPKTIKLDAEKAIERVLKTLPKRSEAIIKARFGIDGKGELTLSEVGKMFGVSRGRIRQIEDNALRKLRHPARSRELRPLLEEMEW